MAAPFGAESQQCFCKSLFAPSRCNEIGTRTRPCTPQKICLLEPRSRCINRREQLRPVWPISCSVVCGQYLILAAMRLHFSRLQRVTNDCGDDQFFSSDFDCVSWPASAHAEPPTRKRFVKIPAPGRRVPIFPGDAAIRGFYPIAPAEDTGE